MLHRNVRDRVCQWSSEPRRRSFPSDVCVSSSKARAALCHACVPDGRCHQGATASVFLVKPPSPSGESPRRAGHRARRAAGVRGPSTGGRACVSPRSPLLPDQTSRPPGPPATQQPLAWSRSHIDSQDQRVPWAPRTFWIGDSAEEVHPAFPWQPWGRRGRRSLCGSSSGFSHPCPVACSRRTPRAGPDTPPAEQGAGGLRPGPQACREAWVFGGLLLRVQAAVGHPGCGLTLPTAVNTLQGSSERGGWGWAHSAAAVTEFPFLLRVRPAGLGHMTAAAIRNSTLRVPGTGGLKELTPGH